MNPIQAIRERLEHAGPGNPVRLTNAETRALLEMADEGAQRGRAERIRRRRETKTRYQIEDALREQMQRVYAAIYAQRKSLSMSLNLKNWALGRTQAAQDALDTLRETLLRVTWK